MSLKRPIGKVEYMNKKIPKNPKYQSVKTRLDTGCSLTKYMEKMEDIKKNYRYRKDEIFRRLKVTTFAELVLQVSSVSGLLESESDGESHVPEDGLSASDTDLDRLSEYTSCSPQPPPPPHQEAENARETGSSTNRSTLLSVISGVGELNLDENNKKPSSPVHGQEPAGQPYPDCPYLLLDVRDRDQYDSCHVISAYSFPIASLSRTMNPYTKELLEYKNAAGKIIIVYDEDEMIASQAATAMCERGFENLFLLSGGLKVIAQKFPDGLTTGSIPASCRSPPPSARGKKCSLARPASDAAEKRWRFTSDELAKIQQQLDDIGSSCNSRMSSRTASSCHSKASSGRIQSSKPWK